jgi:hypothetical protein
VPAVAERMLKAEPGARPRTPPPGQTVRLLPSWGSERT